MSVPTPEPLIFPNGVRFPRRDEFPPGNEDALTRIANANITTGFTKVDNEAGPFTSYIEANVHAHSVFKVFSDLASGLLPEVGAPIIGIKDDDPTFGPYTLRDLVIELFEPYADVLQDDGFLEFGIIFQTRDRTEEIFVKSSKYIQVWTNEPALATRILLENNIPEVSKLEFIDEYPMVSNSVDAKGLAVWPRIFHDIKDAFVRLPKPPSDQ